MKVVRLEKALEVLQDCSGPEIEGLKSALKKAREAAREPPLEKQISECKEFIERSQKRIAAETVLLEDARQRLARLEQRVAAVPTVPEAAGGVANVDLLQAKLAEAEAERDELRCRKRRATTSTHYQTPWDPNAQIPPMPEDEQALYAWLQERHTDLRDVLEFGTRNEILEMTSRVADGAAKLAEFTTMATT